MPTRVSDEQLRRLHWRCRRGLLENDLLLQRFLRRYERELDERRLSALNRLLDYPDPDLWDIISSRADLPESAAVSPELTEVLRWLRDERDD